MPRSAAPPSPSASDPQSSRTPLNYDVWTAFALTFANAPFLPNSLRFLGASGNAPCSLFLPPGFAPLTLAGMRFDMAAALFDWSAATPIGATNAVPITIAP